MKRRKVLAGCALSATVAGCIDALSSDESPDGDLGNDTESSGDEEAKNDDENEEETEYSTMYRITVEPPEEDAEGEPFCEFGELPEEAQTEFRDAIDGVDFETEDRAQYESEESPKLLDTDCYNQYIEFENEYYWVTIEVDSG